MKTLRLLFLMLPVGLACAQTTSPANTHLLREATIPELVFDKTPLSDAIRRLREVTTQGEEQVNFLLSPALGERPRQVTFDLRGINGMDAFATILSQTKTRAEIRRNIIWILPND